MGDGNGGCVGGAVGKLYGMGKFRREGGVEKVRNDVIGVEVEGELPGAGLERLECGKISNVVVFVCEGGDAG